MKTLLRMTLALLFCVVLSLCITPATFADDGDYTIPANTTVIEDEAFSGCTGMKSVTIPVSVTRIGTDAFAGCVNLTEIVFEGTTAQWANVNIEAGNDILSAFHVHCVDSADLMDSGTWGSLTWTLDENGLLVISGSGSMNLFFPSSTDAWREYKADIRSVVISKGVTSIGMAAFAECSSLKSVTIPDSVTSVGRNAFFDCSSMTSVTIGNGVTSIDSDAFYGCTELTSVHISDIAAWFQIVFQPSMGVMNFSSSNPLYYAHNLYIYDKLVTALDIPDGVTSIGDYAFHGCSSLKSVTIPNSVTSIGYYAFDSCSGLTSVEILASVTSIGDYAFHGCSSLKSVTIPNSVTSIGYYAFYGCSRLTSVEIPNSVTSIGNYAFTGCSGLTSVTIPNSVTRLGSAAFSGCSGLMSVTIDNGVTSIGSYAFRNCSGLKSVEIPASVESIGNGAFIGCSGLTAIHVDAGNSTYCDVNGVLLNKSKTMLVAYPGGIGGPYSIPNGVTSIGDYAFYGCSGLTSVTNLDRVTSIGDWAFTNCSVLLEITIPGRETTIGYNAFLSCGKLTIYCYRDSYAYDYAVENNIKYSLLEE